ncbi:MAG TPA: hypothetical protein VMT66_12230 [Steroidobacteraceae bacterium]|nr:hypothetical protein [Steroidobacteraceae bacterium]
MELLSNAKLLCFALTGNRCRCAACGEHFNSSSMFDLHRVGDWKDSGANRRCLSVPEMIAKGYLRNAAGFWIREANRNAHERRPEGQQKSCNLAREASGGPSLQAGRPATRRHRTDFSRPEVATHE